MNTPLVLRGMMIGFGKTLLLFCTTLIVALPLGLLFALGARSKFKPLKYVVKGIIWVIRSTPLMLQVLFVSFVPAYGFGILNKDLAAFFNINMRTLTFFFIAIAFILNYSCYFAEIFRGGIESIVKGQYEAGKVLGMTKRQIFFKIILLQVVKKILAPISNEVITLVKDTALASVLGFEDLFTTAQVFVNTYVNLLPFFYAAIFYLIFNGLLTLLFGYVEKKLNFYKE